MGVEALIAMDSRGPEISEEDVLCFERKLEIRLPGDYREFLLAFNGGRPCLDQVVFSIGKDTTILNDLYGLRHPMIDVDEYREFLLSTEDEDFSPDLLLIGHDCGASRICLVINGERRGEVWFNDRLDPHEPKLFLEWYERKRDFKKLANSFTEFIQMLRPYDED